MEKEIKAVLIVLLAILSFFITLTIYNLNNRVNELERKIEVISRVRIW